MNKLLKIGVKISVGIAYDTASPLTYTLDIQKSRYTEAGINHMKVIWFCSLITYEQK